MPRQDFQSSRTSVRGRGTVVVRGRSAFVSFPYDEILVDLFKHRFPTRRWIPEQKVWEIPAALAEDCRNWLADQIGSAVVIKDTQDEYAWIDMIFKAVTGNNREALYKGLAKAFHPDTGGDTEIMKRINDAYRNQ